MEILPLWTHSSCNKKQIHILLAMHTMHGFFMKITTRPDTWGSAIVHQCDKTPGTLLLSSPPSIVNFFEHENRPDRLWQNGKSH
jgi:hypothetical protein